MEVQQARTVAGQTGEPAEVWAAVVAVAAEAWQLLPRLLTTDG